MNKTRLAILKRLMYMAGSFNHTASQAREQGISNIKVSPGWFDEAANAFLEMAEALEKDDE